MVPMALLPPASTTHWVERTLRRMTAVGAGHMGKATASITWGVRAREIFSRVQTQGVSRSGDEAEPSRRRDSDF